jgi:hypothetical protein
MTTYTLPSDRTTDTAINGWLKALTLAPGDTVELAGTSTGTDSIDLGNPKLPTVGVHYDLTGADIALPVVDQTAHYGKPVLHAINLHDCTITGGTVRGANSAHADAVKAGLEGWSGIAIGNGCQDLTLTGQTVEDTWGDFVFVGGGDNQRIRIDNLTGSGSGRHAISARTARGLQVLDSTFTNFRHLFFDHEPASGNALTDLEIGGCTSPAGGLGIFCQVRPLKLTECANLWIHDHQLTGGHYHMDFGHISGVQRQGLKLERLTTVSTAPAATTPLITIGSNYAGWDHITITDLHDRVGNVAKAM